MPTTHITGIKKVNLNKSINYITDIEKTNNGKYITSRYSENEPIKSFNEKIESDARIYKMLSNKKERKDANAAYSLRISLSKNDTDFFRDPNNNINEFQALERLVKDTVSNHFGTEVNYIMACHTNTDIAHCHVIISAYDKEKKYNLCKSNSKKLTLQIDEVSKSIGIETIDPHKRFFNPYDRDLSDRAILEEEIALRKKAKENSVSENYIVKKGLDKSYMNNLKTVLEDIIKRSNNKREYQDNLKKTFKEVNETTRGNAIILTKEEKKAYNIPESVKEVRDNRIIRGLNKILDNLDKTNIKKKNRSYDFER